MKIISINLKCGEEFESVMTFLDKYSDQVDIFCFQEVSNNLTNPRFVIENARKTLYEDLQKTLKSFKGYYAAPEENDVGGLTIFIRDNIDVKTNENLVLFKDIFDSFDAEGYYSMGKNLQKLEFEEDGTAYTLFNFHGMWVRQNKKDTDKRIEQSRKVRQIFDKAKGKRIFCADLNVTPDTQTVSLLAKDNRNLIEEYDIKNTRSSTDSGYGEVVDYIIVSSEVDVEKFEVLLDEVSDHLPLMLEFS